MTDWADFESIMNADAIHRRRVKGGTRADIRLCDSCSHGMILKGSAESEERVICMRLADNGFKNAVLPFRVVECNIFISKSQAPLWEMKEAAWILETGTKKNRDIGFKPYKQWKNDNPHEDVI